MRPNIVSRTWIIPSLRELHFPSRKFGQTISEQLGYRELIKLSQLLLGQTRLRGGVTKKKQENLGQIPKGGGG